MIFFMHHGIVDEMDYWMGEFFLVLFVAIESVIFAWIFGLDKGWKEMHLGADLQVPRIFYYIIKFVTPVFAMGLVIWYLTSGFIDKVLMRGVPEGDVPFLWMARLIMLGTAAFLVWGVWYAWQTHPKFFDTVETNGGKEEIAE